MATLAPSILGADFSRLGDEIQSADAAGVRFFHLDIMDGHFVPNISYGPGIVKTIDKLTDGFLDAHLMLSEPEKYFDAFKKAGADAITFHLEVHPDPLPYAQQIRQLGLQPGLSLNPDMPIEKALPFLAHFDLLLIMSVFPGFGGQSFIEDTIGRIRTAREHIDRESLTTKISVDGGVDRTNAERVVEAGADILVMGTAFFTSDDRPGLVKHVNSLSHQKSRKV
ncbi:ribulose-phosphate 3-epimerase [candidate division GN15 bacterium]|nr:ribulose-phosphate 3-epimerase [candidate division GN15 bacterium]